MRSTQGLRGVAVFRWGSESYDGLSDISRTISKGDNFEKENFLWRMAARCDNHACPYASQVFSLRDASVIANRYTSTPTP